MRDGNMQRALRCTITQEVVSLPMRDGNTRASLFVGTMAKVVSLPMRDGNLGSGGDKALLRLLLAYL